MKKIFTLFIICLFTLSLFSQTSGNKQQTFNFLKQKTFQNKKAKRPGHKNISRKAVHNQPTPGQSANLEIVKAMDNIIYEYYDEEINQWFYEDKASFTYDDEGNNIRQVNLLWDEDWLEYDKSELDFDNFGNISLETNYEWDDMLNNWIPFEKSEYSFDGEGYLLSVIDYFWSTDDNEWDKNFKNEYTYISGKVSEVIIYGWNSISEIWEVSWKDEYTYDTEGRLSTETSNTWSNDMWIALWKYEFTYDTDDNIIMELDSSWDEETSEWIIDWKDEYTYDADGNMVLFTSYEWFGEWVNSYKTELTYDNEYSIDELLMPWWWEDEDYVTYRHMATGFLGSEWIEGLNEWAVFYKGTITYVDHDVTGISNPSVSQIAVYPNPATDNVYFELAENAASVEFFDIQGRMVFRQEISGKKQINVSQLNKGLYIYKLLLNGNAQSGKIMIE